MELFHYPFSAMASPCELRLYAAQRATAEAAAELAIAEVQRIEQRYSRYRDDSIVSRINAAAGVAAVTVDDEAAALLNYADAAFGQSEGLFDITSGVLRRVWDFKSATLPGSDALQQARALIGWDRVHWAAPEIFLPAAGMEIDFGGFGKEWAADAAARICLDVGIEFGLVELGGDIHAIGPHPNGDAWQIGIRDPRNPDTAAAILPLHRGGLASSGDYERFMIVDNRRYSHILNPQTGWPVENSFASVSVVAPLCLVAGTAATVAMLKGEPAGISWLRELALPHFVVTAAGDAMGSLQPPAS